MGGRDGIVLIPQFDHTFIFSKSSVHGLLKDNTTIDSALALVAAPLFAPILWLSCVGMQ